MPSASGTSMLPPAMGGTQELTTFVQNLLQQMQSRFEEMSNNIITRIDEMGTRVDDLEKSIEELMQHAGTEDGENPAAIGKATKKK